MFQSSLVGTCSAMPLAKLSSQASKTTGKQLSLLVRVEWSKFRMALAVLLANDARWVSMA